VRYELTREKYLNDAELSALLLTFSKFEVSDFRNVCLLRLALETGSRASELLNLTAHDFDYKGNAIYVHGLKGSSDRWIPLRPLLAGQLFSLPLSIDGHPFAIGYKRLFDIWQLYKPCDKRFHSLRHTFALNLFRKSSDIHLVQRALGHRSLVTTSIYMTYSYGLPEMRKAMGL
jgi:integrase/recombinase XerC